MLQYITNTDCKVPVAEQVSAVIAGGCRWVQIRMKDATDDEIREVVEKVKPECMEKNVFLILNDRVELAKELNVGGVHLKERHAVQQGEDDSRAGRGDRRDGKHIRRHHRRQQSRH